MIWRETSRTRHAHRTPLRHWTMCHVQYAHPLMSVTGSLVVNYFVFNNTCVCCSNTDNGSMKVQPLVPLCLGVFALCTNFPERGSHCIVTSLSANKYVLIKLDRVSCTHYFMSIHNLRYSVQLIKIATRIKTNL